MKAVHKPPEECAVCGVAIPRDAHACPNCGADERTGWRETSVYDGLDFPEEETSSKTPPSRRVNGIAWYWWCAGVTLVALLVLRWLRLL